MDAWKIRVHLASGKGLDTEFEVERDLDEDEVLNLIHQMLTLHDRPRWATLGGLEIHTAAIQAVEIL